MFFCFGDSLPPELGRGCHADSLGRIEQDVLGRFDSVVHEHGHRHGPHAAWHWRDEARLLSHT